MAYEYNVLSVENGWQATPTIVNSRLNSLADAGWRVVCSVQNLLILEREIPDDEAEFDYPTRNE